METHLPCSWNGIHHGCRVPRTDYSNFSDRLSRFVLFSPYTKPSDDALESFALCDRYTVDESTRLEIIRWLYYIADSSFEILKLGLYISAHNADFLNLGYSVRQSRLA